ncbi:hypothetical protein, partial [Akkermansia sp.]|uniref:hypothetical protein n=1 Tax=Akkermansia sp. TaxID=1872421 RepID=UPI003AAA4BBE
AFLFHRHSSKEKMAEGRFIKTAGLLPRRRFHRNTAAPGKQLFAKKDGQCSGTATRMLSIPR